MRPSAKTSRSRRRRQAAPPAELSKEHLETEVASIESGLKLLEVYTTALKDLKERGQEAAADIKLALDVRHAPRDWSNVEILSAMSEIIDEHPRPKLEFVLGVLGVSKVPDTLDERLRSQGAKAYAVGVRTRALRKKKEAKEREERERREKKEREERERREEQERKERKEREEREKLERERIEKERLEREKAEEEKRKAALRKEAEQKRLRGKGRKGRRGRPPTRAVATERAKNSDIDKGANDSKEPVVSIPDEVQNNDGMDVEARGRKLNRNDNTTSKTDSKAETKEATTDAELSESVRVEDRTAKASSATSRGVVRMQMMTKHAATKATNPGSTRQKGGVATTSKAVKSEHETSVAKTDEEERNSAATTIEPHAKKEGQEATETGSANHPLASGAEAASQKAPMSGHKATDEMKEVVTTPTNVSGAKAQTSKNTTPKIIEESKIASALKESAAAVNREMPDVHGSAATAKDIAADVGTGVMDLSGVNEKKEAKKAGKEKTVSDPQPEEARITRAEAEAGGKVTLGSKTAKEPTEQKVEVKTPHKSNVNTKGKDKITDSPAKSEDAGKVPRADVTTRADKMKEKPPAKASKPDDKDDSKLEKASKEISKPQETKDADEEAKKEAAEANAAEADDETGKKEPELETEDFMADVFGSDVEGDKEDTEEASEKRGRRYRTRGRQSDASVSSDDQATKKRESDEEAAKEQRKRGRPKGGARRVSRRMSNMRDEIMVAPTGRRMRRESRNLMNRAWELPEPDQYLLECVEVWERVHANKISIPFREPVTAKDAPGYFDIVKQPMDLKTVKEMLQDGRIASPGEFYENMRLIVTNAFLFNDRDSDLYDLAMELRDLIRKDTKPIVKAWKEARGLESEESESEVEDVRRRGRGRPKKKGKAVKSKKKRKRGKEEDGGKSKKRRVVRRSSRNGGEDDE